MAISKLTLSGSTDGRGVLIAATSSPGTTIHTGSSTATDYDEIWLYISNPDSLSHTVTFQWGGTTSPNDSIVTTVDPYQGLFLAFPGLVIKGNATPLVIKAYVDTANVVAIHGYVNRIGV